jgi:DNA-binding transcriptional LysR family regulator
MGRLAFGGPVRASDRIVSFSELRAFLLVAEKGSFLAAAIASGESRTTLRRHVDALEARAGVPLLHRDRRGVIPTEAGTRLLASGRIMEREFTDLLTSIRETGRMPAGTVRVLLPVGLPMTGLSAIQALLKASFPQLRFRLTFYDGPLGPTPPEADVVAWFGETPPPGAWEARVVTRARQRLLASPAYLEMHGTPTDVESLCRHDLAVFAAPDDPAGRLVTRTGQRVPKEPLVVTSNVDFLHATARSGAAIAWVPDGDVPPPPGEPPLVPVLEALFGRDVPVSVGVPAALVELPKVRVFLENLTAIRDAGLSAR